MLFSRKPTAAHSGRISLQAQGEKEMEGCLPEQGVAAELKRLPSPCGPLKRLKLENGHGRSVS